MSIEKLQEFARDGQKNTDELTLTDGFPVGKKPARQWFNWLFNIITSKTNEIIDSLDTIDDIYLAKNEVVNNLTTNDATKPLSAAQGYLLQQNKLNLTGGTLTGGLTIGGTTSIKRYLNIGSNDTVAASRQINFWNDGVNKGAIWLETTGVLSFKNAASYKFDQKIDGSISGTAASLETARIVSFSGAATGSFSYNGSSNSSCVLTLANSGVEAKTYGSNIKIPIITVNAKGLITSVSEQNIPIVDNLATEDAAKPLSARQGKILSDFKLNFNGNSEFLSKSSETKYGVSRFANVQETEAASSHELALSPAKLAHYLNVFQLGFNLTVNNISLDFINNVDYWNTSKKAWDVYVYINGGSSTTDNMAWVNGIVVGRAPTSSGNGCFFFFKVPPGGVFKVFAKTSIGTIVIYK